MSRMLQALKQLSTKETAGRCAVAELAAQKSEEQFFGPPSVAAQTGSALAEESPRFARTDAATSPGRRMASDSPRHDSWTRPWAQALSELDEIESQVGTELTPEQPPTDKSASPHSPVLLTPTPATPSVIESAWQAAVRRKDEARRAAELVEAERIEAELQLERQRQSQRQAALQQLEQRRVAQLRERESREHSERQARETQRLAVERIAAERRAAEQLEQKLRDAASLEAAERQAREQQAQEEQQLAALHREAERLEQMRDEARQSEQQTTERFLTDVITFPAAAASGERPAPPAKAWNVEPKIATVRGGDLESPGRDKLLEVTLLEPITYEPLEDELLDDAALDADNARSSRRQPTAEYLRLAGEMLSRTLARGPRAVAIIAVDAASAEALEMADLARAMALAESGETLLVPYRPGGLELARSLGADLARAAQHHRGGSPADWIVPTNQPGLSLLPHPLRNTGDAPLGDVLLLPRCKRRFSLIMVDAGAWDEAAVPMLQQADAVFVVLTLGHTEQTTAADVTARLRRSGIRLAGCLLTEARH